MTSQESQPTSPDTVPTSSTSPPTPKLRPGRVWYLVALAAFIAGMVTGVVGLATTNSQVDSFQRVTLPGSGEIVLNDSGDYVIYYETESASLGFVPNFNVEVTPVSDSATVESLEFYDASLTYTLGSRKGVAILVLKVASPGTFRLEAPDAQAAMGGSALAVGPSIAGKIVVIALAGGLLGVVGVVGAITIAVVRHIRKKRARSLAPQMS